MFFYEKTHTNILYAPWVEDKEFQATYNAIKNHTLVDIYRCYSLWCLVEQVAKLPTGQFLEVGVWRGGTGALISKAAEICRVNSFVYLCDTFKGVPNAGEKDSTYFGGEHADTTTDIVHKLLHSLSIEIAGVVRGNFPTESGLALEELSFRFCHIDVDVYQSAKDVTEWVWPRLMKGGVIVYDDYGFVQCNGVTQYVNEIALDKDKLFIYNLTGQAVIVKI